MLPRSVTPLGLAVLALLFERPMHPYEMWQLLGSRHKDRLVKVRPGSLYHSVERLERDGLVVVAGTERQGNRPERTTYEITLAGRAAVGEWVADTVAVPAPEYPRFALGLAELHNLRQNEALAVLDARIEALETELDELTALVDPVRGVPELFTLSFSYTRAMVQAELDWLRTSVGRVRRGEIPWLTEQFLESMNVEDRKGNR